MTRFCPNCGKPVTDDITKTCSNCGKDLSTAPSVATTQASTTMDRGEIFGRAIPFFATKTYAVQTQTDYVIAFESQNRDVNWIICHENLGTVRFPVPFYQDDYPRQ